jgi:hypothetical protein
VAPGYCSLTWAPNEEVKDLNMGDCDIIKKLIKSHIFFLISVKSHIE